MAVLNCLMPVQSSGDALIEAFESLKAQTFQDFEIIALVESSNKESLKALEKIKKKEKKLHILRDDEYFSVPYALNQLMKTSKSPFFAFQGENDLSHPNRFLKLMDRLKNSSLLAIGSSITVDQTQVGGKVFEEKAPYLPKGILHAQIFSPERRGVWFESAVYSKKILKKPIEFEETMPARYDILFHGEIQHYFPLRMSNLQETLYTLRVYPGSSYDLLEKGRIRIDKEQIENFNIKKLLYIFTRYIRDVQLTPAVKNY